MATIDVIREEVRPPIKEVRLTLTPKEAETILVILRDIGGYDNKGGRRAMINRISDEMVSKGVPCKNTFLSGCLNIFDE